MATIGRQGKMNVAGVFCGLPRELRTRCNIPGNINRFIEIATVLSSPGPRVNWGIRRRRDDMLRTLGTVTLLTVAVVIPFKEAAAQDPLGGAILGGATGAIIGGVAGGGRGAAIGAGVGAATGAIIGAEAQRRREGYYWWRQGCYVERRDGTFVRVSSRYCG